MLPSVELCSPVIVQGPSEPVVAASFDLLAAVGAEQVAINLVLVAAVILAFVTVDHDLVAVE